MFNDKSMVYFNKDIDSKCSLETNYSEDLQPGRSYDFRLSAHSVSNGNEWFVSVEQFYEYGYMPIQNDLFILDSILFTGSWWSQGVEAMNIISRNTNKRTHLKLSMPWGRTGDIRNKSFYKELSTLANIAIRYFMSIHTLEGIKLVHSLDFVKVVDGYESDNIEKALENERRNFIESVEEINNLILQGASIASNESITAEQKLHYFKAQNIYCSKLQARTFSYVKATLIKIFGYNSEDSITAILKQFSPIDLLNPVKYEQIHASLTQLINSEHTKNKAS